MTSKLAQNGYALNILFKLFIKEGTNNKVEELEK